MKKLHTNFLALAVLAAAILPLNASAHCGGCGVGDADASADKHSHAQAGDAPAIFKLAQDAGFNTLVAAIQAAGLEMELTDGGPYTVFAPTDEAFAKLPEGQLAALLEQPETLKKILLYHVVSGNVMAKQVIELDSAQTLGGTMVAIDTKNGVMINDAKVLQTDIEASNGTVHVIDTVLIPENL